ncbi:MAG: T9SS type A sorting domain-containing protein [Chitinophagales bacterium]|nr:T9SS type A sorting domain-containing protein [Chitinophagales bacterium]
MQQRITILVLFSLLAISTAIGQNGSVKLITSYAYSYFEPETGEAVNNDSIWYVYNNDQQVIEEIEWRILPSELDWKLFDRRHAISYDAAGHRLTLERQVWTGTTWLNYARYTYSYDAEGRRVKETREAWSGGNWVPDDVTTWEYDAQGHLLSEKSLKNEILYTYNTDGYTSTVTISQELNAGVINKYRAFYDYLPLSGGLPVSILWQQWNINAWENTYKYNYEYNTAGNTLNIINETWNGATWYISGKTSNTYNGNEKITCSIKTNLINGIWVNDYQDILQYDVDGDLIFFNTDKWHNGGWSKFLRVRYHYKPIATQDTPTDAGFSFFPNPASTFISLKSDGGTHANIYDQQGRLVRSQSLNCQTQETFQLGILPAGNYLLQVLKNDGKLGVKPLQIRH